MGMKSITFAAAWSSLMKQEKRRERPGGEYGVSFNTLYQQYYPVIFAFLHFLVGTPEVAEDLVSLVFEKVWMHLTDIQALDTAAPSLFPIAPNCATDYFRRCKPATSLGCLLPDQQPPI